MTNVYILSMNCVNGDDIQIRTYTVRDVVGWLKKIDHEGSAWMVTCHVMEGDEIRETHHVTDIIEKAYTA